MAALIVATVGSGLAGQETASAQSCGTTTAPATTYGQVKQQVSVTTAGTYRLWSRIKAPNATNNSYYFQVDGGCAINVGDAANIPANAWTWVNYQNGSAASITDITLTAGNHEFTYTGKEADVQLDRVLLLSNTSCTPTGTGDDCANIDVMNPTVSLTSPAANATVEVGTPVTITANASDNVGVAKVEFYADGALVNTDTASPYSYSWPTTGLASGAHNVSARAYDAAGNSANSATVNINLTGGITDTTPPNTSLTAPANNSSVAVGTTVNITATASDNVGVAKVEFYNGTTLLGTDTTSPYSYSWNTTGQTSGAKSLTSKAYDASNNSKVSAVVTLNLTGGTGGVQGDANGDSRVNALDLSILISKDGQNHPPADFNNDGTVGAADLSILLGRWTW